MSAPIFRDPVEDGAADPVVIRRVGTDEWWMFYTNRRPAADGPKSTWIHGSRIGLAMSIDSGASWHYRGLVEGLDEGGAPHADGMAQRDEHRQQGDGDPQPVTAQRIHGATRRCSRCEARSGVHELHPCAAELEHIAVLQ